MKFLTSDYIEKSIADSSIIYKRGVNIFEHGLFLCRKADWENNSFAYEVDGNYGDYVIYVNSDTSELTTSCSCPYPGTGCKHTVAALLDISDKVVFHDYKSKENRKSKSQESESTDLLTTEEIKEQALNDRKLRAKKENFVLYPGEMYKGEHLIETTKGVQYVVTLHDPENQKGHCSCPDFLTSRLNTCKHLIFTSNFLKKENGFSKRVKKEKFPFLDIFWDSATKQPRLFKEKNHITQDSINRPLSKCFAKDGTFTGKNLTYLLPVIESLNKDKRVKIRAYVIDKLNNALMEKELTHIAENHTIDLSRIKGNLYPYQEEGVKFCLYKKAVLIGDEMGLGKTLQAIVIAVLKKEIFGFGKTLVITLASLKEQWKREIEKFSQEHAQVIAGSAKVRQKMYEESDTFFKITNYEAVLRDITIISRFKPDFVILDEAQRIKNFNTKTAEAVKAVPKKHSLVLTGTPLENKLEDVYSIVQFLDPELLSPLWMFASNHLMLSRSKKGHILGCKNLNLLHDTLKPIVIRRKKEEVLSELPDTTVNNYYIELTQEQAEIHKGYLHRLIPLINKKFLTPMDLRRILEILLKMRQVCDSTFLIDRKTNISPKLKELAGIIDEIVIQNNRKVVIFTEWTTMIYLIAKQLSKAGIPFVEMSGKIPVHKRQLLIDEFTENPECRVFLSSDAGGTGLNLQAADCVINFELPWNPAKMNQRIGRVSRIGQKSKCINVVNLIAKFSIEEKILAGIQLKTDLFKGVFEGGDDTVEFSREKRNEMLNRLRKLMGEEPEDAISEPAPAEEIPEDTPHYLNPDVLDEKEHLDYDKEEGETSLEVQDEKKEDSSGQSESIFENHPPEKIEKVLNSGMNFIGGLMEMATGQKIESTANDDKMISINNDTGEVTMKFKLPGF